MSATFRAFAKTDKSLREEAPMADIGRRGIAGPSIFPTAGASNPTFTIFALSQRGAERMASQWGTLTN
jgi:hypothetical protein